MLTKETIKSNTVLSTLSDDQINAVAELSKNDENTVIAGKTREIWDSVDADIKTVTGEDKPTNVKSYEHLKATLGTYKTKADNNNSAQLQTEINTLKGDLATAIKGGNNDPALKAQIDSLELAQTDDKKTIESLRTDLTGKDALWGAKVKAESDKNIDLRFETAFANSLTNKTFLAGIPTSAIDASKKDAKLNTKKLGVPEFKTNDDGSESIIFRDDKGLVITNPQNLQKPLTASEHYISLLGDVIDSGRKQKGGESNANNNNNNAPTLLNMGTVTNKAQGDEAIRSHLKANDVQPGSEEFTEQYGQMYADNKVGDLPTR